MRKKVLVSGNFNIIHPGHLRLLRFAKECGDYLIVAVNSDAIARQHALVPEKLRLEGVLSNSWVDEAFITGKPVTQIIQDIQPHIVVKGKEYENLDNEELGELNKYGGKLIFSSGESTFSTTDLIRNDFLSTDKLQIKKSEKFMSRHKISNEVLIKIVKKFTDIRVCIIGDLIVDEYISCNPLGMSQEDPTIVVSPIDSVRYLGGAGIVAAHAVGLGANVSYIGVCGNDEVADFANANLRIERIESFVIVDDTRPTTLKQRYRSKGKTLLRVNHFRQDSISTEIKNKIIEIFLQLITEIDLLIFSDFNYGCLPQDLVDELCKIANDHNIMVAADCQSSSQIGDVGKFRGVNLLTPTEYEARLSLKNFTDGLVIVAEKLMKKTASSNIILKMGEDGALIHSAVIDAERFWHTDKIEPLAIHVKDTAGAGDSMLTASSMALAVGADIWAASYLGSIAAAIQVSRIGNIPMKADEILKKLT